MFNVVKSKDESFNPKPVNNEFINEDGTPKVFYHGTTNNEFTAFDFERTKNGSLGRGFYFSGSKEYAKGHTISKGKFSGRIIEAFINIKNPYITKYPGQIDTEKLKLKGYDGIYNPANDFGVVFDNKNIKSATDNIGTFSESKDICFSTKDNPSDVAVYFDKVRKENKALQNILATMEEQFSSVRNVNNIQQKELKQEDIDNVAKRLLRENRSKYDYEQFSKELLKKQTNYIFLYFLRL